MVTVLGGTDSSDEGFYIFTEKDDSWSIQGRFSWDNTPIAGSVGLMIREAGQDPSARHITVGFQTIDGVEQSELRYRNILQIGGLPTYEILTEDGDSLTDPGGGSVVSIDARKIAIPVFNRIFAGWRKLDFGIPECVRLVFDSSDIRSLYL
jgi:hypothetical protein